MAKQQPTTITHVQDTLSCPDINTHLLTFFDTASSRHRRAASCSKDKAPVTAQQGVCAAAHTAPPDCYVLDVALWRPYVFERVPCRKAAPQPTPYPPPTPCRPSALTAGGSATLHSLASAPVQSCEPNPLKAQLQMGALLISVGGAAGTCGGAVAGLVAGAGLAAAVDVLLGTAGLAAAGNGDGEGGGGDGGDGDGEGLAAAPHSIPIPVPPVLAARPVGR